MELLEEFLKKSLKIIGEIFEGFFIGSYKAICEAIHVWFSKRIVSEISKLFVVRN